MPKYTNGEKIISATEKAYKILYKARGFKKYENQTNTQKNDADSIQEEAVQSELMELRKDELLEMAQEMQLEVNDKMTKAEIVAVIEADDAQ